MIRLGFAFLLVLSGCGARTELTPQPGAQLPPKPAAARTVPTAEQLMTPEDQARPMRNDDVLQDSVPRASDRFDLPPPGQ